MTLFEVLINHCPEAVSKVPAVHQLGPEDGVTQAYSITQVESKEV